MRHEVDTSKWKEFKVGELFDVLKGRRLTKADMIDGDTNFIGSSAMNNGITAHISNTEYVNEGGVLTVCYNGSVGETFYQDEPFWASDDVNILKPKQPVTREALLFVGSILRNLGLAYDWVDKWTRDIMLETLITLPAVICGDPDWDYMDTYMSKIIAEEQARADELVTRDISRHEIDVSGWKEFQIGGDGGLFDVVKGTRLTRANMVEGDINFVSASSFNNGIAAHIANTEKVHPGNLLTVSYNGSDIGRTFYQAEPFWASDDVNVLYPRFPLTRNIAMFLAPLIKEVGSSHIYKDKWLQEDMMAAKIPLPIDDDAEPDWGYMDARMFKIMREKQIWIDKLMG